MAQSFLPKLVLLLLEFPSTSKGRHRGDSNALDSYKLLEIVFLRL